ncbi:hypothetical protein H8356DRAFT_973503 [Neocallimastix lanati (nom. inval.)]|jgi:hypothetical protein|uniref:CBM10 domain-containing protein n=1 Tax=Neocallimastix californiae TaxID=1754190 RepID=A0A1Y2DU00_9FUNG|nr:hypothetical protein H8356DRAFT_973503 [Neocallimastix sp. JGI-2020a]ORY62748.1 hypothetical protein LY90DRAFT_505319 [Neocallimastix californiae]|eukprot:ORY62748.1 hypothetical protein LY90DRAFT_505319 [Neocallimastix californiae]
MRFNSYIFVSALCIGLAKANFFEGFQRPELFEITELNMPTIRLNIDDEAYNRFQLTYKCMYDTHPLNDIENEDCYSASWNKYNEILESLVTDNIVDTSKLTIEQQDLINNKQEISYDDFKSIITAASSLPMKEIFSQRNLYAYIPLFEEKKASLEFTLNGETIVKEKVKITVGGKYTQNFEKPQFNVNIKDDSLYGIKHLRLRSEVIDPSFLRSKLGSDLTTVLGFPSNHATYSKVFLNNDDMGLYLLRDAIKANWVEYNFGVANTTSLYTCDLMYGDSLFYNCVNEETEEKDEDITNFSNQIENAKTVEELDQFFDTDLYIKWQAYKYLTGSWDHVTNQHNQYLYKDGDKWLDILYDFDSDLGAYKIPVPAQTFSEESLEMDFPIYKLIGLNDNHPKLVEYIKEMVTTYFNPVKVFPHIDELVEYLYPYVVEDRTPEDDPTARPGHYLRSDHKIENGFTADDFLKNSEFTNIFLNKYYTETNYDVDEIFGVKRWIIERFRFVCTLYSIDCSFASEYLEGGSFEIPNTESTDVVLEEHKEGCSSSGYICCRTTDCEVVSSDEAGDWCMEGNLWCLISKNRLMDKKIAEENSSAANPSTNDGECWSLAEGYPCCQHATKVENIDEQGRKWSVENDDWCGIIEQEVPQSAAVSLQSAVRPQPAVGPRPTQRPGENPFNHI